MLDGDVEREVVVALGQGFLEVFVEGAYPGDGLAGVAGLFDD